MTEVKLSKLFKGNHYNVNNDFSFNIVKQENYNINRIEHVKNICTKKIVFWTVNNQLHHELDVPSFEFSNGIAVIYCKNGKIHRDNKPAVFMYKGSNGSYKNLTWYQNGVIEREGDLPASIYHKDDYKEECWYKNGVLHRDNDLPAVIDKNKKEWYQNGKKHRLNGAAFQSDYIKKYYINNKELTKEKFEKTIIIINF